ncbi:hypothetical protein CVT25_013176 [Psilocybe cyanescens]|uniref:F-box domain-containing protein n=1 Tax=Psilocybe cyanescens TaxID=93625 RepID=A0A409XCK0_PSICY|nr:hypothetical protein CVT25_013176 [Psilocybe cyanescens]
MKEWLRRSGTVPLSLTLHSNVRQGAQPPTYLPVIDLLRSHSGRWNQVKICGPWRFLYELFNNLEHIPPIATFEAKPRDVRSESEHIDMLEPICPKEFTSRIFPLEKMPLQWNNLTLLNAKMMCMDDVLHIISNANGLLDCTVKNMLDSSGKYPLPTKPIVHHGLNRFKISRTYSNFSSNVFPYQVLPSLDTPDYDFVCDPEAFNLLVSFLDRSRPSLQTFTFTYSFESVFSSWYERMPKITHLNIHCWDYHGIFPMTEELFKALARPTGHPVLPHLRKLLISINRMPNFFWPLLCDIFRDTQEGPEISEDDVGAAITPVDGMSTDDTDAIISPFTSPPTPRLYRRRRPLDQIYIRPSVGTNLNLMMDESILNMVVNIQRSGILLEVVDLDGKDMLVSASRICDLQKLPFWTGMDMGGENEMFSYSVYIESPSSP